MNEEMEYEEMRNTLYGLAEEVNNMTEEEKLLSLKKIVQTELSGKGNRFWTTISKKMLINQELPDKILLDKEFFRIL